MMADVCRSFRPQPLAFALAFALLFLAVPRLAVAQADAPMAPAPADAPASGAEKPPAKELTADLVYRLLIGDIALQRGEPALAARAYFEAAREAKDPLLARRAT